MFFIYCKYVIPLKTCTGRNIFHSNIFICRQIKTQKGSFYVIIKKKSKGKSLSYTLYITYDKTDDLNIVLYKNLTSLEHPFT